MKYEYTKEKRDPQIQWYNTESGKRWRVKFSIMKNNKRHYIQKNGLQSFADAKLAKAQLLAELDHKYFTYSKNTTVEEYWRVYHDAKSQSGQWRNTTSRFSAKIFPTYILPYLGSYKMSKLTRPDIQNWVNTLSSDKDLSKETVLIAKNMLKAMLENAVVDDYLLKNPARKISVTGRPKKDQSMTYNEYQKVKEYMSDTSKANVTARGIFALSLYGLRRGEIAGMQIGYITPTSITVAGQLNNFGEYTPTKTGERGNRTIPITPETYRVLLEVIEDRKKQALRNESRILGESDYLFSRRSGKPVSGNYIYNLFATMSKDLGFKVWPHKMRHAFATQAFNNPGVNPKDIMNILGHTTMDMTMQYNTGTPEGMEKVVNSTFGYSAEVPH